MFIYDNAQTMLVLPEHRSAAFAICTSHEGMFLIPPYSNGIGKVRAIKLALRLYTLNCNRNLSVANIHIVEATHSGVGGMYMQCKFTTIDISHVMSKMYMHNTYFTAHIRYDIQNMYGKCTYTVVHFQ